MIRKSKEDVDGGWQSSTSGDKAWKEATDEIASRNAAARKEGRKEREAYEKTRDANRDAEAAKRHAKLLKRRLP